MGATYKPIGKAVATARGHYPLRDGRTVVVAPGTVFEIFEGRDKAKWFTALKLEEPAAVVLPPAPVPKPPEPDTLSAAAAGERKRKAAVKPPTADELV